MFRIDSIFMIRAKCILPRDAVRKLPMIPSQSDKFKYEIRGMPKIKTLKKIYITSQVLFYRRYYVLLQSIINII